MRLVFVIPAESAIAGQTQLGGPRRYREKFRAAAAMSAGRPSGKRSSAAIFFPYSNWCRM